jgi:hypothetical protein
MSDTYNLRSRHHQFMATGSHEEMSRIMDLYAKWDELDGMHVVQLFDDGLEYEAHCINLILENDKPFYDDLQDLYRRTKKQGKTPKTAEKKIEYFKKSFGKIWYKHRNRLFNIQENQELYDYAWDNRAWLERLNLNQYFIECDPGMINEYFPIYKGCNDYFPCSIEGLNKLENSAGGISKPITFDVGCTKIKIGLRLADWDRKRESYMWVKFNWEGLQTAPHDVNREFEYYDLKAKLMDRIPGVSFLDHMDRMSNLYGSANKWEDIYITWPVDKWTWDSFQQANDAMKELIVPLLGTYREGKEIECKIPFFSQLVTRV